MSFGKAENFIGGYSANQFGVARVCRRNAKNALNGKALIFKIGFLGLVDVVRMGVQMVGRLTPIARSALRTAVVVVYPSLAPAAS